MLCGLMVGWKAGELLPALPKYLWSLDRTRNEPATMVFEAGSQPVQSWLDN
jgi:hypothetical protein